MAWIKIPKDSHPLLIAALPKDPRVRMVQMFGATVALVNGNMFGGTFARSAVVRLAADHREEALALDGAEPFDPMGNKRVMADTVLLPESIMDEPGELRDWLARAFAYTATLPPKRKRTRSAAKPKPTATKARAKSAAKPTPKHAAKPRPSTRTTRKATQRRRATSRA